MQRPSRVGFVGLGNMGWPMARNLVRAGFELTVRDADAERQRRFAAELGAAVADSPADFADSEVLITMLPTGAIVRDVLMNWQGGLARAMQRGSVVIDMSSSEPAGTRELGRELGAFGVHLVDAPVSGGVPRAEAGSLSIMMGADDGKYVERVRPALDALGQKFFATGKLGSGHAMKALNNYVAAAGFAAAAEALIIGRTFGLEPAVMVDILNASTGRNFSTEYTFKEHVVPGKFATGFMLGLITKDVAIADGLAAAVDVEAPLLNLMTRRWSEACAALGATRDHSAAIQHWEKPG